MISATPYLPPVIAFKRLTASSRILVPAIFPKGSEVMEVQPTPEWVVHETLPGAVRCAELLNDTLALASHKSGPTLSKPRVRGFDIVSASYSMAGRIQLTDKQANPLHLSGRPRCSGVYQTAFCV